MKGKFFTAPRILASLISVLIGFGALFLTSWLFELLLFEPLRSINLLLLKLPQSYTSIVGASLAYFSIRALFGSYYLNEETDRSILYGVIEIPLWIALTVGVYFLFSYLESVSKVMTPLPVSRLNIVRRKYT
jgi:hypothetical protein